MTIVVVVLANPLSRGTPNAKRTERLVNAHVEHLPGPEEEGAQGPLRGRYAVHLEEGLLLCV